MINKVYRPLFVLLLLVSLLFFLAGLINVLLGRYPDLSASIINRISDKLLQYEILIEFDKMHMGIDVLPFLFVDGLQVNHKAMPDCCLLEVSRGIARATHEGVSIDLEDATIRAEALAGVRTFADHLEREYEEMGEYGLFNRVRLSARNITVVFPENTGIQPQVGDIALDYVAGESVNFRWAIPTQMTLAAAVGFGDGADPPDYDYRLFLSMNQQYPLWEKLLDQPIISRHGQWRGDSELRLWGQMQNRQWRLAAAAVAESFQRDIFNIDMTRPVMRFIVTGDLPDTLSLNTPPRADGLLAGLRRVDYALAARRLSLSHPAMEKPILIQPFLRGDVAEWGEGWLGHISPLQVVLPTERGAVSTINVRGDFMVDAAGDALRLASATLRARAPQLPLEEVPRWIPSSEAQLYAWMNNAFQEGDFHEVAFVMQYDSNDEQPLRFDLTSEFRDAVLLYDLEWPPLRRLSGTLNLSDDGDLNIVGNGRILGIPSEYITARMTNIFSDDFTTLALDFSLMGTSYHKYQHSVDSLPIAIQTASFSQFNIEAAGMELSMTLDIPIEHDDPDSSRFQGDIAMGQASVSISLAGEAAHIDLPVFRADTVHLHFDDSGRIDSEFFGTWADADAQGHLMIDEENYDVAIASTVHGEFLARLAHWPDAVPLFSEGGVALSMIWHGNEDRVFVDADFADVALYLPPPLAKRAAESGRLHLDIDFSNTLQIIAQLSAANNTVSLFAHADTLHVALNETVSEEMFQSYLADTVVVGSVLALAVDAWEDTLREIGESAFGTEKAAAVGDVDGAGNKAQVAMSLAVATHDVFSDGNYGSLAMRADWFVDDRFSVSVAARPIAGVITYDGAHLQLSLQKLSLAAADDDDGDSAALREKAREVIPAGAREVALAIATLTYGEREFGALAATMQQSESRWMWRAMTLQNPVMTLGISPAGSSDAGALSLFMAADDAEAMMRYFGNEDIVRSGELTVGGVIDWRDAFDPYFGVSSIRGTVFLQAENVEYLPTESGILRIFAVLSPESWLSFGFTDVVKEGIVYDNISGRVVFHDGFLHLPDMLLENETIDVTLLGRVNYIDEKINMRGQVKPGRAYYKSGTTILTPVSLPAQLAVILFGKVFEGAISEIGSYDYTLVGPWDDLVYHEIGEIPRRSEQDAAGAQLGTQADSQ